MGNLGKLKTKLKSSMSARERLEDLKGIAEAATKKTAKRSDLIESIIKMGDALDACKKPVEPPRHPMIGKLVKVVNIDKSWSRYQKFVDHHNIQGFKFDDIVKQDSICVVEAVHKHLTFGSEVYVVCNDEGQRYLLGTNAFINYKPQEENVT
ncbi:MAG: hypothetical protein KAS32_25330 [Candidatus Peribacteraceae bacterium]|nr:hypothetical protein [Candidatus Peribacteraceae bacterium]